MESEQLIFQEVQRFRNPVLWTIFLGGFVVVVVFCGYGACLKPLSLTLWAEMPRALKIQIITAGLAVVFFSGLMGALLQAKLITQVSPDGLFIRWYPLHFSMKKIPLENVERVEALTYHPVKAYGGWGLRRGGGGRVYNIHGDRGVKIYYVNGGHILIGSQKPDELARAIESIIEPA